MVSACHRLSERKSVGVRRLGLDADLKYRGAMQRTAVALLVAIVAATPPALSEMADAERAFAKRASQVGVRDSFLEFLADDAIRFDAEPSRAKPFFEQMKPQPPSAVELTWEPRYGDVAASGELGYLTGPASRIVHTGAQQAATQLAYFSIWKRQPDGTFKVFIDQGITTPQAVTFPDGFTRPDASNRYSGNGADGQFTLSRADAMRQPTMNADVHVYRDGEMPFVGQAAAKRIVVDERERRNEPLYAESAKSADLGITYGRYQWKNERGHYLRVWTRSRTGRWALAFEVTAPGRSD